MARRMFGRGLLAALGLASAGLAIALGGCSFRPSFRYKMTVEVQTPQGVKTGHAVREVSFSARANGGDYGHVKGEAVAIDLPNGDVLFALLTSGDGDVDYAGNTMASLFKQLGSDTIQLWPDPPRVSAPIIGDPLPMLVRFRDVSDPRSVERVDKANLAATFGIGYALKRITVEKTDEPVTVGIGTQLPWLSEFPEPSLNSSHGSKDFSLSATLHHGDFRRGNKQ